MAQTVSCKARGAATVRKVVHQDREYKPFAGFLCGGESGQRGHMAERAGFRQHMPLRRSADHPRSQSAVHSGNRQTGQEGVVQGPGLFVHVRQQLAQGMSGYDIATREAAAIHLFYPAVVHPRGSQELVHDRRAGA